MNRYIKIFFIFAAIVAYSYSASAQTNIQQLALEAHDGDRITGFIYQNRKTAKDAPIAILLHGLMGSSLHWLADNNLSYGDDVTALLIKKGFRVVALDARAHGARKNGDKPIQRVKKARAGNPEAYIDMIENTVTDYNTLIKRLVERNFKETRDILVIGYSMGAQMSILLAAENDQITHLITMVPPAVKNVPKVSPLNYADKVTASWLLMTAEKDEYSKPKDNSALLNAVKSELTHKEFESGHVLPKEYVESIEKWINDTIIVNK
jgi:pimeloyl-ACP methyl ester carboxylesterase